MKNLIRILCLLFIILIPLAAQKLPHGKLRHPGYQSQLPHVQKAPDYRTHTLNRSVTHTAPGGVDTAWVRHYGYGLISSDAVPRAIVVDQMGNVYVTGGSYGWGNVQCYATIKYNSSGDTVWVRRYNGAGNGFDEATSLAVDASGNVYVTGGSYGSGTGEDYATIKYNSSGDTSHIYNTILESTSQPRSL